MFVIHSQIGIIEVNQKFYSKEIVIITDRCMYHINTVLERRTSLILNIALH